MYTINNAVSLGQKLTKRELLEINRRLPAPDTTYVLGETVFEVYKAKWLYTKRWTSSLFFRLVIDARTTYYRYGDLKLFDDHDNSAAIYLVRVRYPMHDEMVEEWFSNRFIPGAGDFDLFLYRGEHVKSVVERKLAYLGKPVMDHLVTSSRTCGIMPYRYTAKNSEGTEPLRQKCSALSYALLNRQFFQDCMSAGITFSFLEGVVREEFIQKSLTVYSDETARAPLFTPIHETLGLEGGSSVTLNRSVWGHYVYQFPAYFLHNEQLAESLKGLVEKERLKLFTLQHYLGEDRSLLEGLRTGERVNFNKVQGLGKFLTVQGELLGSSLSGQDLRFVLDREVGDGPELKLTPTEAWVASIDAMLENVRVV